MSKNMLIDSAHAEEVRIAVVENGKLDKFDFETRSKVRVKGNVYLAKVIRVEPSLQAAFVDYGGNRHGFLSFSEIHYDYFQIPVNDRQELEAHLQNAIAAHVAETGQTAEELDQKEIARLRYQFYRRYKIQEVIKKRQIMLVQVTKEERGNKGAALTTYISLAGRYCVLMPNTPKGSGVSRKITNRTDREKLKKIVSDLHIDNGSTVIRTAGVGHTKAEIKKDFSFLVNVWNEIRETTLKSSAPCLIHEEAGIIKRSLRDMYSKEIESVVVEGEEGYKTAKKFMKKLMPSHSKKVKSYDDKNVPLFSKYKLNEQINQIYSTRVDLPSGGYLIINNTEALIAIDVNSGKSTRERNIAGTALKTNLEAAQEIARQCRLRDLAGLIVVDFIDMEEKRNNLQVERCMREALKNDKAKIQVGVISNFGLLEFSRQRLRSSIADANMIICPHCRGTGFSWSEESLAIQILRKIEEACISTDFKEIIVTLPSDIALYIFNNKRSFISAIESRGNIKLTFHVDHHIASNDFKIDQIIKPIRVLNEEDDDSDSDKKSDTSNKDNGHRSQKLKTQTIDESKQKLHSKKRKNFKPHNKKSESESNSADYSEPTVLKIAKLPKNKRNKIRSEDQFEESKQIEQSIDSVSLMSNEANSEFSSKETNKRFSKSKKLFNTENAEQKDSTKESKINTKTTDKQMESKEKDAKQEENKDASVNPILPSDLSTKTNKKENQKATSKNGAKKKPKNVSKESSNEDSNEKLNQSSTEKSQENSTEKPKKRASKKAPVKSEIKSENTKSENKRAKRDKEESNKEEKSENSDKSSKLIDSSDKRKTKDTKKSKESRKKKTKENPVEKEGNIDFSSSIEEIKNQKEIASQVIQSFNDEVTDNTIPTSIAKKKRSGWWQKLLNKPNNK